MDQALFYNLNCKKMHWFNRSSSLGLINITLVSVTQLLYSPWNQTIPVIIKMMDIMDKIDSCRYILQIYLWKS